MVSLRQFFSCFKILRIHLIKERTGFDYIKSNYDAETGLNEYCKVDDAGRAQCMTSDDNDLWTMSKRVFIMQSNVRHDQYILNKIIICKINIYLYIVKISDNGFSE